ncbi:MAG: penicillin-binding transpeptidase domain-containing protein [Oscillibacter sp.]
MPKTPRRKSDAARRANQMIRSRTVLMMVLLGVATFALLFMKLYDLQINQHEELQTKAVKQQTRSTVVTASRGTIYDRSGSVLAISATAETVFVSPAEIEENAYQEVDDKKILKQHKAMVARGLARILEVPEEAILKKMNKTLSQYEVLKKRTEQAVSDEVRRFINGEIDAEGNPVPEEQQTRIHGVYLAADSKRYYPYGTLGAHVIGFVNADNNGAYGLEAKYESELQGTSGLTVTAKNAVGTDLLYQYEQYYDAENGSNLVLTLDINVQEVLEKGLESMVAKFGAKNGATGIVMNAKTGALLAMASYPTYDLNSPNAVREKTAVSTLEKLDPASEAYTQALEAAQYKQWRNKCINDTYEPGSTFKPITLAAAVEEGLVNLNTTFNCSGSIMVPGWKKPFGCSKKSGHGHQTLMQATGNSCNPAFIGMGLKIGTEKYYQYLKSFGLMEPTGVDMNGEAVGIFASEKSFNSNVVSLASYAFGQTFTVTPLQVIRAQAACINGGYLNTPYVVEQALDDEGNIVAQHDATPVRQVVSEETSAVVRQCLEYVVASGTGKNGQVVGYRIGGKTGTADKTGDPNKDVVVSYMSFAPADDPQVIMLITMDSPSRHTGTYVSGGNMVGPTASRVMGEILPYLGIEPDYTAAQLVGADATVPNVVGTPLEAAKTRLGDSGFGCKIVGKGDTVTDQTPVGGTIIPNNASVIIYLGEKKPASACTVPNVVGMTAAEANKNMTNAGLIMRVTGTTASSSGNVHAISQREAPGTQLEAGTVVTVQFGDSSVLD